ncbi:VWA domain-containing protein [Dactylosporangium sp. CA-139066]|uniref:VWA domain-containing protein n=1 Tax=Dactylosporangium sp. CA-139066 TaxID=3239930 RepID=UPI003D89DD8F
MRFQYPLVVAVAAVAALVLILLYVSSARRRSRLLAGAGLATTRPRRDALRRHLPQALFLVAATLLLLAVARPEAPLSLARSNGTVVLAFDVSNSMKATDVAPSRLAAAQAAAKDFVDAQPDGVSFGIVAFDDGALLTQQPTTDHAATNAAIQRLRVNGGTSLSQAVLASLTVVVGKTVTLPREGEPAPDLGYFGNATIVLLTDGDDNTGGDNAVTAAGLAAKAGVRIETVGVGTVDGATVEVDGVQRATALDEDLLTRIAQTTAGNYHRADSADALHDVYQHLDLRLTVQRKPLELTGAAAALAVLLLTVGGILMTTWFGRIL